MNAPDAIELIIESTRTIKRSRLGRYSLTCRDNNFIMLPIEDTRKGDPELCFFTDLDLSCGLSNSQWWKMHDAIREYVGGSE